MLYTFLFASRNQTKQDTTVQYFTSVYLKLQLQLSCSTHVSEKQFISKTVQHTVKKVQYVCAFLPVYTQSQLVCQVHECSYICELCLSSHDSCFSLSCDSQIVSSSKQIAGSQKTCFMKNLHLSAKQVLLMPVKCGTSHVLCRFFPLKVI